MEEEHITRCGFKKLRHLMALLDLEGLDKGSALALKSHIEEEIKRRSAQIIDSEKREQLIHTLKEEVAKAVGLPELDFSVKIEQHLSSKDMNHVDWYLAWRVVIHSEEEFVHYERYRSTCKSLMIEQAEFYNLSYCGGHVVRRYLSEQNAQLLEDMFSKTFVAISAAQKEAVRQAILTIKENEPDY